MAESKRSKPAAAGKRTSKDEGALMDAIARKAYEIYEERGREHGKDFEHWLEAEAIVKAEMRKLKKS